jgi:hypothetical protein
MTTHTHTHAPLTINFNVLAIFARQFCFISFFAGTMIFCNVSHSSKTKIISIVVIEFLNFFFANEKGKKYYFNGLVSWMND